jgi:hypothetical protein
MTPDLLPKSDATPAGLWVPTGGDCRPKSGVEVPILYRPRKNSKPQLRLAYWDQGPRERATDPGPGWVDEGRGEFYRADKVSHWLCVLLPDGVK